MDWMLPNARRSDFWREGRKILDRSLGPSATMSYRQMVQENTHRFLARLLATPKDFRGHIDLSAVTLPYTIFPVTALQLSRESCDVPHIWLRSEGRRRHHSSTSPSRRNVGAVRLTRSGHGEPYSMLCGCIHYHNDPESHCPCFSVKYIPSWVPWFSYEPLARTIRRLSEKTINDPINFVKNAMVCFYCVPDSQVD